LIDSPVRFPDASRQMSHRGAGGGGRGLVHRQAAEIRDLKQQMAELKALSEATQVALLKLQAKDERVAQR
jgi:hypothetical protein